MRRELTVLAVALLAGCGATDEREPVAPARAAEPQQALLRWRESYPDSGAGLRFAVDRLDVRRDGWSVAVAVTNSTRVPFEIGPRTALAFGVMLFATDDPKELDEASRTTLPPLRRARRIEPSPPRVLAPNSTWRATLSAPGSLADGSYLRVSFGPFSARGTPPEGMRPGSYWITDRAYRL